MQVEEMSTQAIRRPSPRVMTRCECSGVPFTDVAREVYVEGRPLDEVLRTSGCGQTCGACLPDLRAFLSRIG